MKVLITFFPIDDMGGIINHHEQLCAGFKDLGHEVTTKLLVWRDSAPASMAGGRGSVGHSGLEYDQRRGFSWKHSDIIPYKGGRNLAKWQEYASQFDLIIWQVAVPTKRKENRGNLDWLHLYSVPVKQVAIVHDGNFLASYPWMYAIAPKLAGLACVHDCAYNSGAQISVPRARILNPQDIRYPDISEEAFNDRTGFLSVQTWKAWKRVPELLRALTYARSAYPMLVAGKGIDYYYLTSKDKCKYPGVWEAALHAGMDYLDVITNEERDRLLGQVTCLVDASWSKKYGAIGAHYNRVAVDAIMAGAVPVMRDMAVGDNPWDLFQHDINCLTIPWDATPQEFGALLDEYCNMPYDRYRHIMENALALLPHFERAKVAQQFIELSYGAGLVSIGTTSDQVKQDGADVLINFFRGE